MTTITTELAGLNFPGPWVRDALCAQVDPEWWFPKEGGNPMPAKRVCRTCPVAAECLEYALTNGEKFGIFGGATPTERAALLRRRGRV